MNYIIKGSLCGYLCEDCTEPLSGIEVRLYQPWQQERVMATALAATKETFHYVSKEEAESRKNLLIATTQTDKEGNFSFSVDEKWADTAFDIDFVCATVPRRPPVPPRREPLQFHLTTIYPQWRANREQNEYFYQWKYCLPAKTWCYIRGHYFDAWVICGYVRACQTGAAIPNAEVTAWDADFLTDDNLGTAITDGSGHFRIDYTSVQFKQTFLSPWLNVETDPGTLTFNSGPDVYFKVKSGSLTIINETAANRRNNVDYCLCVDLCTDVDVPVTEPVAVPAFLRIGGIDHQTGIQSLAGQSGLTNSNYAFYSSLRLNGIVSQTLSGQPMEYCFEYTNQYDAADLPINWTRVHGNQIDATNIGYIEKASLMPPDASHPVPWYQYNNKNCVVNGVADSVTIPIPVAADGWIAVPQQNDNPFNLTGVGKFVPNGNQIILNSVSLNAFPSIDLTGLVAGNSSASTGKPLATDQVFALKMLVRQQGNDATIAEANQCTRIAIDNTLYTGMRHHPSWGPWGPATEYGVCMVDIQQLQMAGCAKIDSQVDILYTCAHPNLGSITVTMKGPLGDTTFPPPAVHPDSPGVITHLFTVADPKCAYLVTLAATYQLTTGDGNYPEVSDQIAFCR